MLGLPLCASLGILQVRVLSILFSMLTTHAIIWVGRGCVPVLHLLVLHLLVLRGETLERVTGRDQSTEKAALYDLGRGASHVGRVRLQPHIEAAPTRLAADRLGHGGMQTAGVEVISHIVARLLVLGEILHRLRLFQPLLVPYVNGRVPIFHDGGLVVPRQVHEGVKLDTLDRFPLLVGRVMILAGLETASASASSASSTSSSAASSSAPSATARVLFNTAVAARVLPSMTQWAVATAPGAPSSTAAATRAGEASMAALAVVASGPDGAPGTTQAKPAATALRGMPAVVLARHLAVERGEK
ncbi:hypothetical protein F5883DRAFT_665489 [Diaporthe sp. PMI_573]|nr:hypothetical protein F5883DRAFT_665489 [Diaporthaceae sp. PMI_573]